MAKLIALLATLPLVGLAYPVYTQPIISANDGTNTVVNAIGNRLDITGGQFSGDRANLFHSFQQFGLNANQIANFLSNPNIQNILGRVVGGDTSVINGLIQVTGGNSNLFLMNPAGIIFGNNASLNVGGAFTATTANGIGFGNNFFNAIGTNNYSALVGNPNSFAFTMAQPAAIINTGDLVSGKDINFLGGTVISSGNLSAPNGQITLTSVPGETLVRLSQVGDVIGLEFQPNPNLSVNPWGLSILTLPQLLTGANLERATGLTVRANGDVVLTSNNLPVKEGDIAVKNITANSSTLSASNNLTLVNSQLQTSQDLNLIARNAIAITDSLTTPFVAIAGTKLLLQGHNGIDIFALNNSASGLFSGTDMILRSANTVNGDARYFIGGNFRIEKLDGSLGNLFSPFDPVFQVVGDFSLASYTGASLHIQAGGKVTIPGDITITGTDTTNFVAETFNLSDGVTSISIDGSKKPTLDIRAGTFGLPGIGDITIGNIIFTVPNGNVLLTNQYFPNNESGKIKVGNINVGSAIDNGGSVTIDSRSSVNTGSIITNTTLGATSGSVRILAQSNIATGAIDTTSFTTANAGNINLSSTNDGISAAIVDAGTRVVNGNAGNGGNITIRASKDITVSDRISSDAFVNGDNFTVGNGGDITVNSITGNITASNVRSGSVISGNGTTGKAGNISIATAGNINILGDVSSNSEVRGTTGTTGNGANTTLMGNNITTNDIGTLSVINNGAGNGNVGRGGDVKIEATGNIAARRISSTSSVAQGNTATGGNISVNTTNGNINILADVTSASATFGGNATDAGEINFSTLNGNINVGLGILAPSFSQSGTTGNGGNITLTTGGNNSTIKIGTLITPIPSLTGSLIAFSSNSPNPNSGGKITLTTDQAGFTGQASFTGNVSTNADINFNTSVVLPTGSNITISSGDRFIDFVRFNSQLDGAANVIFAAGTGAVSFNGDVGSITPLSSLTVNANTTRLSPSIKTTGNINFNSSIRAFGSSEIISENGAIAITGDVNVRILALSANQDISFTNIFSESTVNLTSVNAGISGISIDTSKIEGNVGGGIKVNANNNIAFTGDVRTVPSDPNSIGNIGFIGGNISISSTNGSISTGNIDASSKVSVNSGSAIAGNPGNVTLIAGKNINVTGKIETSSIANANSGSASSNAGADVTLIAGNNINVGGRIDTSSFASSQLATVDGDGNASIVAGDNAGNVILQAGNSVSITDSIFTNSGAFVRGNFIGFSNLGGKISISGNTVNVGGTLFSAAIQQGGDITVDAVGDILIGRDVSAFTQVGFNGLGAIAQKGGEIALNSSSGNITVGGNIGTSSAASSTTNLLTQSGNGGNINILAALGNIAIAGSLDASSVAFNANSTATTGNGGNISLIGSSITTNDITSNSITNSGGRVGLLAQNTITTGRINTSSVNGNGGAVIIDPSGLTQVTSINAQGGRNGIGGEILINFGSSNLSVPTNFDTSSFGLFRATGSFTALSGLNSSISNQGGLGGAPITIRHSGNGVIPFIVGDINVNGTRAAISNTPTNAIASGSFLSTFTQGNPLISIISLTSQTTPPVIPPVVPPIVTPDTRLPQTSNTIIDSTIAIAARPPIEETPRTLPNISLFTRDLVETATDGILRDLEKATGKNPAIITVQFTPTGDRLVLVLSTSKGKVVKSLPVSRKQVIDQADNLSLEVAVIPIGRNNPQDYLKPAQSLYQWLVAPLDAELELQKIDTVLFEMPEGMRDRPIAAFHDGKKFMVEKYSLGLIPNLNLVDTRYRSLRKVQALVMGASEFSNPNLKPLPAVPLEVKVVGNNWRGASFLNQNFNLDNLTTQRNQTPFGIIHLATHAEFISGGDSYIQLWGNEKLKPEQIRNLGWRDVELLVLSACKTATGDQVDQLGFAGLAFQSGVKSVLASLWQVSDEGTLSLMSEFYRQMSLPEITIKAEGLRQAQLSMLNKEVTLKDGAIRSVRGTPIVLPTSVLPINGDLSHPFYWAGFALVGSPW